MTTSAAFRAVSKASVAGSRIGSLVILILSGAARVLAEAGPRPPGRIRPDQVRRDHLRGGRAAGRELAWASRTPKASRKPTVRDDGWQQAVQLNPGANPPAVGKARPTTYRRRWPVGDSSAPGARHPRSRSPIGGRRRQDRNDRTRLSRCLSRRVIPAPRARPVAARHAIGP